MASKECCYCEKVFARSLNLRRNTIICRMNERCCQINANIGSQEPYEDSDMSSADGTQFFEKPF